MCLIREDFLEVRAFVTAVHSLQERFSQEQGTPAADHSFRDDNRLMQKRPG